MKIDKISFENCIKKTKIPFKLKKKHYLIKGKFPVVSQESNLISGYHNKIDDVYRVNKPVLIFGDHTQVLKYVDFDFVAGADGVKILLPIDKINTKYFYYLLKLLIPKSTGYARHYRFLKKLYLPIPSLEIQKKIVSKLDVAFTEIDNAIELFKSKKTKLESLEILLHSKIFNDIKFQKIKLSEVVEYVKKNAKNSKLPYIGMENISSSTMKIVGEISVPESTSSTFEFDQSVVLFGRLRPYLRKALLPNFKGQCSTEIFCVKPNHKLIRDYLAYWLLEPKVSKAINSTSTGARMPRANMKALLNFQIPLPPIPEQKSLIKKIKLAFEEFNITKNSINRCKENYLALKSKILLNEFEQIKLI